MGPMKPIGLSHGPPKAHGSPKIKMMDPLQSMGPGVIVPLCSPFSEALHGSNSGFKQANSSWEFVTSGS